MVTIGCWLPLQHEYYCIKARWMTKAYYKVTRGQTASNTTPTFTCENWDGL